MTERIRSATAADVPSILRFIRELAEFEKLAHEVVATEEKLHEHLFGSNPAGEVLIAEVGEGSQWEPAGFALFFTSFSTFLAQPGIYLEDLFVLPQFRSHGLGRKLLAELARLTVSRNYGRLEWSVLDWNTRAWDFYRSLGAVAKDEWTGARLTGPALIAMSRNNS
jgi:GNAT superfamily N-acetyltransferase